MKIVLFLMTAMFALSACNTVKGVSRDIQSGARAVEQAAEDASD